MKRLLILLLFTSFIFANLRFNYSNFSDGTTFMGETGASYSLLTDSDELTAYFSKHESNKTSRIKLGLSYDFNYDKENSYFLFSGYENNPAVAHETFRVGLGTAFWPCMNRLKPPFSHKLSYALIYDTEKSGLIHSFRYKFEGFYNKFGLKVTSFYLFYMYDINSKITYKINKNVSIIYKSYFVNNSGMVDNTTSLGVEVIL